MIGLRKKQEEQKAAAAAAAAAAASEPTGEAAAPENGAPAAGSDAGSGSGSGDATASASGAAAGAGRGRGRGATIWGVKGAAGAEKRGAARKLRPGEIRVTKDISDLDGGEFATPRFPDPNDLMNFEVDVAPDSGYWAGHKFTFSFHVPDMYPHEPPKVRLQQKIYHPNVDLSGNVCLNILRADWKPVLDINAVIYGLIVLFVQPNPDDPLNHEAAKCMREDLARFKRNVERSLKGLDVDGISFPPAPKADPKPAGGKAKA